VLIGFKKTLPDGNVFFGIKSDLAELAQA